MDPVYANEGGLDSVVLILNKKEHKDDGFIVCWETEEYCIQIEDMNPEFVISIKCKNGEKLPGDKNGRVKRLYSIASKYFKPTVFGGKNTQQSFINLLKPPCVVIKFFANDK